MYNYIAFCTEHYYIYRGDFLQAKVLSHAERITHLVCWFFSFFGGQL